MQNWIFGVRSRPFFILLVSFLVLAVLVNEKVTLDFDNSTLLYFQSAAGNHALDLFMWIITEIGDVRWLVFFSLALVIIRRTRRLGLILLLTIVAGTIGAGYIKGYVVDHLRPQLEFMGSDLPFKISKDTFVLGTDGSFPSGHATRATAVALILGYSLMYRFPKWRYLIWIFPVIEAFSRVYVLEHYPTDVIGGTIFGMLFAGVISNKLKLHEIFKKKSEA